MAISSNGVVKAVLQYDIDAASLQKTLAGAAKVTGGIDDITEALNRLTASGVSVDDALAQISAGAAPGLQAVAVDLTDVDDAASGAATRLGEIGASQSGIAGVTAEVEALRASLQGGAADAAELQSGMANIGGGDAGGGGVSSGTLRSFGTLARVIPGGSGISRGFRAAGVIEQLTGASISAETLGAAAGALIPVFVEGAVVISKYNSDLAASTTQTNAYAEALTNAFEAGTTKQIEALKNEAEAKKAFAEESLKILQDQQSKAISQAAQSLNNASIDISNGLNAQADSIFGTHTQMQLHDTSRTAESYNEAIAKQQADIGDATVALEAYGLVAKTATVATGDFSSLVEGVFKDIPKVIGDAAKGVTDQTNALATAFKPFGDVVGDVFDKFDSANAHVFTDFFKGIPGVIDDVFKDMAARDKAQNTVDKSQSALNSAEQSHADKRLSIVQNEADNEATILGDARDNAIKLGAKYGVDSVRAQEDLNRELKQLRDQANFDEGQAVANRDAATFGRVEAQEKLTENKDKENARVAQQRRQQDYATQLHDMAVAAQKRLDQQRAAEIKALALEDQRWSVEQARLQQQVDVNQQAFDAMGSATSRFADVAAAAAAKINSAAISMGGGNVVGSVVGDVFQQHATGDLARYTGLHWLEKGERVLTLPQTAQYDRGGGNHYTLNLNNQGMLEKTVKVQSKAHAKQTINDWIEAL